jgi:hypothetical protein
MSEVAIPALSVLGFFVGMLLWTQLTRWVGLLYVSCSKLGGDFLGPPKRRLLWAVPIVGLLHPAPWLFFAAVFFGIRAYRSHAAEGWAWLFGGLALAILFMILSTVVTLTRWRRSRQSDPSGPNKSLERTREG